MMLITKELIMTLLVVFGIGKYSELNSPKYYELITEDGKTHKIKIDKNSYACPLSCLADHFHYAILLDEDEQSVDVYNVERIRGDDIFLNSYAVITSEEIKKKKSKNKKLKKLDIQTYLP